MFMPISRENLRPQTVLSDFYAQFAGLRLAAQKFIARQTRYRQTMSELQALSARELADLGIHRSHIRRLALEAMKKEPQNEA